MSMTLFRYQSHNPRSQLSNLLHLTHPCMLTKRKGTLSSHCVMQYDIICMGVCTGEYNFSSRLRVGYIPIPMDITTTDLERRAVLPDHHRHNVEEYIESCQHIRTALSYHSWWLVLSIHSQQIWCHQQLCHHSNGHHTLLLSAFQN